MAVSTKKGIRPKGSLMVTRPTHLRVAVDVADQNDVFRAVVSNVRVDRQAAERVAGYGPLDRLGGSGCLNGVGTEATQGRGPKERCGHGEPEGGHAADEGVHCFRMDALAVSAKLVCCGPGIRPRSVVGD